MLNIKIMGFAFRQFAPVLQLHNLLHEQKCKTVKFLNPQCLQHQKPLQHYVIAHGKTEKQLLCTELQIAC